LYTPARSATRPPPAACAASIARCIAAPSIASGMKSAARDGATVPTAANRTGTTANLHFILTYL